MEKNDAKKLFLVGGKDIDWSDKRVLCITCWGFFFFSQSIMSIDRTNLNSV